MSTDPNLNESGRVNLGDISELQKNPSKIYDPTGKVANTSTQAEAEALAEKAFRSGGVSWHLDEEATEQEGRDMFFPRLAVKGLAEKFGVSRPHKEFFAEERNMFLQTFMNDIGAYLFGVDPFNEIRTKNGLSFRPNPKWIKLPVKK